MKITAFYGGSFDPVHNGHIAVARQLLQHTPLDSVVLVPAFHAPHKVRLQPTSAYDRYAMLCLATEADPGISVSRMEIEAPERPYSLETLTRILESTTPEEVFFVIGADSWRDIRTWREWETVLTMVNILVVTRPGVELATGHVSDKVRDRIIDLRGFDDLQFSNGLHVYFTDLVNMDVSATEIRQKVRRDDASWRSDVPANVVNYIEKYRIYK
ncbi:MAG: nicotinate (nicotinamide) nucleotide adenylyltransferase [Acidobacteria bacterium]|nr:nicotinate (nicotinamide) nucleotide adenylyltransferase [Acidobacteriota bacterium]